MAGSPNQSEGIELADAIEALRNALVRAWWDSRHSRIRFRVEPVELTVQAGVTRTGKGVAGVRWHVLSLGGEKSRESERIQIIKLRLAPVLFDEEGRVLAEVEQLIADWDDQLSPADEDNPTQDAD